MTIYDFINTCCSLDNVEFSIFDCNSETPSTFQRKI